MDGDTEAHADKARCSGRRHVGLPLRCCRAAPASRGARGAEGSTAVCHPRSRGLCSKEGNCSGRNLCFNIFFVCLYVCLFKTSSHFPEEALSDIPEEPWGCFFSSFSCSSQFFIPIFCLSFLLSCFSVSFLPSSLSLTLLCTCFLKKPCLYFLNFVLDITTFSRSAPVLSQIPLRGHACQSLVTYGHFGVPVRRGGRGAEVAE